jgi:hypothetical protein
MQLFLWISLPMLLVIFLGLKALITGEVQLSAKQKLGKTGSRIVGTLAILASLGTMAYCYAFLVLRRF